MELPKYHETFIPILEILNSESPLHHRELRSRVRDKYYSDLSEEMLNKKTRTGANTLLDRIGWGMYILKMAKLVSQPSRGIFEITEKGGEILQNKKFTLEDLKGDADYIAHQELVKSRKENDSEANSIENSSPQDLIDSGFSAIELQIKNELLDKLRSIDPYYFEKVILILLKKMGYGDFVETSKSGDGGIDGIINEDKLGLEKIYIQAKRYNENKVREKEIRNFIGAMARDTLKGVFVTTSTFDDSAIAKAHDAQHSIILIDGKRLTELMCQFNVGVQVRDTYEIKSVDEDFFDAE